MASILLTPDNRMMYSLYQYALGKDNIEIEVNSFLLAYPTVSSELLRQLCQNTGGMIQERAHTFNHANSHMQTWRCTFNISQVWCENRHSFVFFFFLSLERFPSLGRSTQSQCAELSQKTGVRALRHYDDMTQGTTLSPETGTQRDSCQRLEPVYQWLAETQGPPRHAHMHIISISLE